MAGETSSDTTRLVVMLSFASIRSPPCSAKPDLSSSILNYSRPDIHISAPHYVSFFVVSSRHLLTRETFTPPYKFDSSSSVWHRNPRESRSQLAHPRYLWNKIYTAGISCRSGIPIITIVTFETNQVAKGRNSPT